MDKTESTCLTAVYNGKITARVGDMQTLSRKIGIKSSKGIE
jgi:hypothetical protein